MSPRAALFLSYASIMMSSIFIPTYALALGASMAEIGLIGAAYGISLFISSLVFSRASDLTGRKVFILPGLFLSGVAFFLQILASSPLILLLVRAFAGASLGIFTAPLIAYAHEMGEGMGTFSSYGSFGWAAGGLIAGAIAQNGEPLTRFSPFAPYWSVFLVSSLLFIVSFFIALGLPEIEFRPQKLPLFPRSLILKNRRVYLAAFLRNFGAYSIWIIFPLFLASRGASNLWIGVLYFINMAGQGVIMRRLDFIKDVQLIKTGLILSTIVFISYTLAPDYRWLIPLQILLAVSYSFIYVGDLLYLTKRNEEKAASVGVLNSILGVCIGLGPLMGGLISQSRGFEWVMYTASILAFLGFLAMAGER